MINTNIMLSLIRLKLVICISLIVRAYDLILIWHSEDLGGKDSYSEHLECLCNLCYFNLLKIVLKN